MNSFYIRFFLFNLCNNFLTKYRLYSSTISEVHNNTNNNIGYDQRLSYSPMNINKDLDDFAKNSENLKLVKILKNLHISNNIKDDLIKKGITHANILNGGLFDEFISKN